MKTHQFTSPILAAAAMAVLTLAPFGLAQKVSQPELLFREALHKQQVEGDLSAAIKLYERVVSSAASNRPLAAKALLELAHCYERQGSAEARKVYERLVRDFGDQNDAVREARLRLKELTPTSPPRRELAARKLSTLPISVPIMTMSADGRYSAYVDIRSRVMLVDLGAGTERMVLPGSDQIRPGEFSASAAISPDGSRVAYNQARDGKFELRIVPANGGESRVILRDQRPFYIADWSRDASSLLLRELRPVVGDGVPQRWLLVNAGTGKLTQPSQLR